jgi:N-succinyl-L-ornithine transcarbamylase
MNFYDFHSISDKGALISKALKFKKETFRSTIGSGKTIALVFLNPSLRTRMSTQEASYRLGLNVICFNGSEAWPWEISDNAIMDGNYAEHIKDAARVISSYADIIGIRCFAGLKNYNQDNADALIHKFIKYAKVPVVNMESAACHPLQSLTDMVTLEELFPAKKLKITLSWAPHPKPLPHAVANSFAQWAIGMGHQLTICHPEGYDLDSHFTHGAAISHDQEEAFQGASIIYAKGWCSKENYGTVEPEKYKSWTIDKAKMDLTDNGKFMHCLPIRRNVIATDDVLDGTSSCIYQQAGNRLFAAQAVLDHIINTL